MADLQTAPIRPRYQILDALRGVALLGVVVYHFAWDLALLGFTGPEVAYSYPWIFYARCLLFVFLFLTGFSLVLAHGRGVRWPSFWRRLGLIAAAATAISIATYVAFPDTFVYFGVLHAITLFSLLALPFLRAPIWLTLLGATIVIALPWFFTDTLFEQKPWSWIGFWAVAPPTNDLVPLFPSFGVTLMGVVAARATQQAGLMPRLAGLELRSAGRALARIGRLTLVLYLAHQPILFGILYPIAAVVRPAERLRVEQFAGSCQATCSATQGVGASCDTYCACALAEVERLELWDALSGGLGVVPQQDASSIVVTQCSPLIEWQDVAP